MSTKLPLYSGSSFEFSVDYELQTKIGEGTFSDVWMCVRRNNRQELAAKILKKNYGQTLDPDTWNAIGEVNVTNSVENHPFLLMMQGAFHEKDTGKVILFAELMKRSLYDVIEAGECPLPNYRIKTYMYQMLEGLKYLHENGFIHSDIKPENILLKARDKLLKIGDFGTTCHVSAGHPYTEYVATRWYRSPECLLTRGWYGTKMDVWATGCVLYEIATGHPLFDGQDENDQLEKIDTVLGSPDSRLIEKFRKHKSDVLVKRYEPNGPYYKRAASPGVGLHAVYQPYRAAYDILKDMVVYDPVKRYSADRLLRNSYFYDIRNTPYEYKMREFEEELRVKAMNAAKEEKRNKQLLVNKKQGPDGDRISNLQTSTSNNGNITGEYIEEPNNTSLDHKNPSSKLCQELNNIQLENQNPSKLYRNSNIIYPKNQNQSSNIVCQKSNNVHPENIKLNISTDFKNVCPKVNCWQDKKQSATSVSTFRKVSTLKNVKYNLIKRPPFK